MAEALSFGCRLNAAESEAMRHLAERSGWAGALVVNTCAVTAEAEAQARQAIRRAARENPGRPILVTGCAAQIAPDTWAALPGVARVIGNGRKLDPMAWDAPPAPITVADPVVPAATAGTRAFLAVQQGCDHHCTFCVIPQGRGPSRGLPVAEAAREAAALAERHREIVLSGVDLASHPDLAGLIRAVLRAAPGLARLRLSSLDPAALDDRFWAVWAEEERLAPSLHLSIQHADDLVLKRMRRRHRHADLLALARRARDLRPGAALGGDLIAGFPTETEAQHAWLEAFIAEAGLAFLHVFPYSPRPGTPAARMPPTPVALRRDRAARLRAAGLRERARFLAGRLGAEEEVLMEGKGLGMTAHGAALRLSGAPDAPGTLLRARVTGTDGATLLGERV
ncbi:MiaB/RimO family radical SAM methylthiotransferase [Sabulicella glaciei]|uniref:Radical SAM protein n=1 Tax=Sabulicella glaciei TaxID=2984948 RepID=A0ABT3NUK6_9PROT|nr:radical SAM protein [Roseococcus sp. MDT2-1-1]MCW8085842.1 radical SAM protein [Roseococcus sp. MDT2-1-1]